MRDFLLNFDIEYFESYPLIKFTEHKALNEGLF